MVYVRQARRLPEHAECLTWARADLDCKNCRWTECGCRITDDSALERAKGRAVRPFLEAADPWLTEARVVAAHGALHKAQVCPHDACRHAGSMG